MTQKLDSLAKTLKIDDFSSSKNFFFQHIRQSIGSYSLEKAIFDTPIWTHSQSSKNIYRISETTGKTPWQVKLTFPNQTLPKFSVFTPCLVVVTWAITMMCNYGMMF